MLKSRTSQSIHGWNLKKNSQKSSIRVKLVEIVNEIVEIEIAIVKYIRVKIVKLVKISRKR
jgi:hypothetical protein